MQIRKSQRSNAKIKMALQGPSGSGKTMSALLLAKGLVTSLKEVCVIDSEHGSADLYSHLGEYNVINLKPPYSPENYISAIDLAEKSGMKVIITDSLSHAWEYLLEYHSKLPGNSFVNWQKINPMHNALIDKILSSNTHVISTMRTKQDYQINQSDGKFKVEKYGLKPVQRDNVDYEYTIVLSIDIHHFATATKDRTGLFMGKPPFQISPSVGKQILQWCNSSEVKPIQQPSKFQENGIANHT